MAQAGIHALLGSVLRGRTQKRERLLLGVILGSLLPDLDNLALAAATLSGGKTEGLHRTFSHSFFSTALILGVFYLAGKVLNRPSLINLGIGLGIGMVMHILVDLLVWFDGVQILWPLNSWVTLWEGVTPPRWFSDLMMPVEFLMMAGFLLLLGNWAQKSGTNQTYLPVLKIWVIVLTGLFVVFTGLVYTLDAGFMVLYGAAYLAAIGLLIGITIRMRNTIQAVG